MPPSTSNNSGSNRTLSAGAEATPPLPDIPLSHLPLRPSSLQLLRGRGFQTWGEVQESKSDSVATFAAELGVEIRKAAGIYREIKSCLQAVTNANNRDSGGGGGGGGTVNSQSRENSNNNQNVLLSGKASDILNRKSTSTNAGAIITFSREVDQVLGGGLHLGELTELSGMPGCGKTQLAMQIAVNATLPFLFGGVQGQVIYVDTEGSFSPERVHDQATALVRHLQMGVRRKRAAAAAAAKSGEQGATISGNSSSGGSRSSSSSSMDLPPWFTVEYIMKCIHVYRVHDLATQTALLTVLPKLAEQFRNGGGGTSGAAAAAATAPPVSLCVIDSIAFHCRAAASSSTTSGNSSSNNNNSSDFMDRTRMLSELASHLSEWASSANAAVLCINQMTTKLTPDNQAVMVPALGESWAHSMTTRIALSFSSRPPTTTTGHGSGEAGSGSKGHANWQQRRTLRLVKSQRFPSGSADFCIVNDGIRGLEYQEKPARHLSNNSNYQSSLSSSKRPRVA